MTIERGDVMEFFYREGRTLEEIAGIFSLSRERIRQILEKRGLEANQGGSRVRTKIRAELRWKESRANRDAHCQKYYGCSYDEALAINGESNLSSSDSPAKAYTQQQKTAAARGIAWRFTFPQWWAVWQESGKWALRGRGKGKYCMSRIGDCGAYEPGNVQVVLFEDNSASSFDTKPAHMRRVLADYRTMTPRQKEIAKLYGAGLKPSDIAGVVGIKKATVQVHLSAIRQKLNLYQRIYGQAA